MKSQRHGKVASSKVEVTNIGPHGIRIFLKNREYFLSYKEYPWFRDATVADILNVKLFHKSHVHWPALDVGLCVESLERPSYLSFCNLWRNLSNCFRSSSNCLL